jgi:hypothetical protein
VSSGGFAVFIRVPRWLRACRSDPRASPGPGRCLFPGWSGGAGPGLGSDHALPAARACSPGLLLHGGGASAAVHQVI